MIAIIIQARMGSTRLPGKVLMEVSGMPLIWYVLQRCKAAEVAKIIVATTNRPEDKIIVNFCKKNEITCFRGSTENVLQRYYQCAKKHKVSIIIRVTSDCPLIDASLINRALKIFLKSKVDYLSNTVKRTFPIGFDFEIFSFEALAKASTSTVDLSDCEHVTPYIWKNRKGEFKILDFVQTENKSNFRLTVDTAADFKLVRFLIEKYRADNKNYSQITRILEKHPELVGINKMVRQKMV